MASIPKLRLLVFDFDGVLTENSVLVMQDGTEGVLCSRADGLGFGVLRRSGLPLLILSTEKNPVVSARARKLKVPVLQGVDDKDAALRRYCGRRGIPLAQVAFVGNHVNDLPALRIVGYPIAVADCHPSLRKIAWKVLKTPGGKGVSVEIAERLLRLPLTS